MVESRVGDVVIQVVYRGCVEGWRSSISTNRMTCLTNCSGKFTHPARNVQLI
jgi:hypothetical protein